MDIGQIDTSLTQKMHFLGFYVKHCWYELDTTDWDLASLLRRSPVVNYPQLVIWCCPLGHWKVALADEFVIKSWLAHRSNIQQIPLFVQLTTIGRQWCLGRELMDGARSFVRLLWHFIAGQRTDTAICKLILINCDEFREGQTKNILYLSGVEKDLWQTYKSLANRTSRWYTNIIGWALKRQLWLSSTKCDKHVTLTIMICDTEMWK